MSTVLNVVDLSEHTQEQVETAVQDAGSVCVVEVPLSSVNHSQGYWGPAIDTLHALYVGESLRPFCAQISSTWFEREIRLYHARRPPVSVHFHARPKDTAAFAAKLHELAGAFSESDDEERDRDTQETLSEFQDVVEEMVRSGQVHFAELTEEYREFLRKAEAEDSESDED